MELKIDRRYKGTEYTIGSLYVDGSYFCDTLEDTDRGIDSSMSPADITKKKIYGKTAIPTGTYNVDMNTISPRFKDRSWAKTYNGKIPRLLVVPGFDGVLIHPGNTASDTLGCILVGRNTIVGRVTDSTATFHNLMKRLLEAKAKGESISITIV